MIRVFFVLIVIGVSASAFAVPAQWSGNGHFYEQVSPQDGITWTQARDAAATQSYQGFSGHLATLTSAAEAQFIYDTIPHAYAWIGLTDEVNEGTYKWITGEPFNFNNWLPNEPNNSAGDPPGEDYATLDFSRNANGWNDYQDISFILGGPPFSYLIEYDNVPEPTAAALAVSTIPAALLFRRRRPQ